LAHYLFGKGEKLTCVSDVGLTITDGQPLCLAYKTTTISLFAPFYFHDDGYVLAVKGGLDDYYQLPAGGELASLQASGALPAPLPAYHIPFIDYAFGYVLWFVIGFMVLASGTKRLLKQRRKESLKSSLPAGATPLEMRTKTDRWLGEEAAKLLASDERVEQQAYGFDLEKVSAVGSAFYVVLTNQRLLVIRSRIGALGPLRENRGVISHERKSIERVDSDERHLHFVIRGAAPFDFFADWSERHLSNQHRFLRDVPRLFGNPMAALMPSLEAGGPSPFG
jgi:hypothetical protein